MPLSEHLNGQSVHQGIEKTFGVQEHKLRCKHFLQDSMFERFAAKPN